MPARAPPTHPQFPVDGSVPFVDNTPIHQCPQAVEDLSAGLPDRLYLAVLGYRSVSRASPASLTCACRLREALPFSWP